MSERMAKFRGFRVVGAASACWRLAVLKAGLGAAPKLRAYRVLFRTLLGRLNMSAVLDIHRCSYSIDTAGRVGTSSAVSQGGWLGVTVDIAL